MRIGVVGPAEDDPALLRDAAEFLLGQADVDQAIYLGSPSVLHAVTDAWAREVMDGPATWERFLERAAALALSGESRALDALLAKRRELERLRLVRGLPSPHQRTVELLGDKVVLFVKDKARLDPEDIENALLIVYGRSTQVALHRFGPRAFFTPGPLSGGQVAVIEQTSDGLLAIARFDPHTSEPLGSELIAPRRGRVVVAP